MVPSLAIAADTIFTFTPGRMKLTWAELSSDCRGFRLGAGLRTWATNGTAIAASSKARMVKYDLLDFIDYSFLDSGIKRNLRCGETRRPIGKNRIKY
jgi:hypothetical protein